MNKSTAYNTRTPDRRFNGSGDPLVKILFGVGIVLTLMFCVAVLLKSLVGVTAFLVMLKSTTRLLGVYAVVGAIFGSILGIQHGKTSGGRSAWSVR